MAPVAVHASLALTVAGARGDTRRQVLQVLGVGAHPPAAASAVHGAGGSRDSVAAADPGRGVRRARGGGRHAPPPSPGRKEGVGR